MSTHRFEVYMDSYNSQPIIQEMGKPLCLNVGDEITREDWMRVLSGPEPQIELKVKVEDIRHLFVDAEDVVHTISVKVVPVD